MATLSPHDPEMWLELEPIYTDALRNCRSSQIPPGIEHGVALRCLGLSSHVLHVNVGATSLLVVLVPRLGGWGTKIFQVSAVGHGRRVLGRLGLRGPDESDLPVSAHGDETAWGST